MHELEVAIYLNPFDNTPDDWHETYAEAVCDYLNAAELVYDGTTGEVRKANNSDDDDHNIRGMSFLVRPPHRAPKAAIYGVWTCNGQSINLKGSDFDAALLEAYNAGQKQADDAHRDS